MLVISANLDTGSSPSRRQSMTSRRFGLARVWHMLACNSYNRRFDILVPQFIRIIEYSNILNYFCQIFQPLSSDTSGREGIKPFSEGYFVIRIYPWDGCSYNAIGYKLSTLTICQGF